MQREIRDSRRRDQLIVFLKAPRAGFVKTRIAKALGPEKALDIYRHLAGRVLEKIAGIKAVEIRFTPDDARAEIAPWMREGWAATGQGPGGLGQRLSRAFHDVFRAGAERAVIIGSDCPEVTEADIREAWAGLAEDDVVLGPAADGGYWLVGLKRQVPELFAHISWSSENVLEETIAIARLKGLKVRLLRELRDIDTPEGWEQYRAKPKSRE